MADKGTIETTQGTLPETRPVQGPNDQASADGITNFAPGQPSSAPSDTSSGGGEGGSNSGSGGSGGSGGESK